jgi:hypothetical protein
MKKCKKYSIIDKLKYIDLVNQFGISEVSLTYGIDKKLLKEWSKKKNKLLSMNNKENKYRLPGGGAKSHMVQKEHHLIYFILVCKKVGIKITPKLIIKELLRINSTSLNKNNVTLKNWCYRFLKKNYSLLN